MMNQPFVLAPRYRLDEGLWLQGIDPSRHYWIQVNDTPEMEIAIAGLTVSSISEWQDKIRTFRALQPSEQMEIQRAANGCTIHCISSNCYAVSGEVNGAQVWHLFDAETLESLLRTAHPDWQSSYRDVEKGRHLLAQAFGQTAAA